MGPDSSHPNPPPSPAWHCVTRIAPSVCVTLSGFNTKEGENDVRIVANLFYNVYIGGKILVNQKINKHSCLNLGTCNLWLIMK